MSRPPPLRPPAAVVTVIQRQTRCTLHTKSTECVGKFLETADVIARRPRAAVGEGEEEAAPPTPMMFVTSELVSRVASVVRARGGGRVEIE